MVTPISSSTMPTAVLPTAMDRVASISKSSEWPPVSAITSLEVNMLKQPPSSAPLMPLKMKQASTWGVIRQKTVKVPLSSMQQQSREYFWRWSLKADRPEWAESSQKWPRMKEPTKVPTLKVMGIVDLQSFSPTLLRYVGIHSKKPQRMHLINAKARRQSWFDRTLTKLHENYRNFLNFDFLGQTAQPQTLFCFALYSFSAGMRSPRIQSYSSGDLGFTLTNKNTIRAITILKPPSVSIEISHLQPRLSTSSPVRPKPIMSPKSPLAAHMPIAFPYFLMLKRELFKESRVGQAPNWQNPNSSSPSPGSTNLKRLWLCMSSPTSSEVSGITMQPTEATTMNSTQVEIMQRSPWMRNRKKKPKPREMQTVASRPPRKRSECAKASWRLGLISEQVMRMEWRAAQAKKVMKQVFHLSMELMRILANQMHRRYSQNHARDEVYKIWPNRAATANQPQQHTYFMTDWSIRMVRAVQEHHLQSPQFLPFSANYCMGTNCRVSTAGQLLLDHFCHWVDRSSKGTNRQASAHTQLGYSFKLVAK